ncbi:phage integrase family protein [Rhodococcus opacus]|nr:phage integrase family protein [Rhodococcus opacus]
MRASECGTPRPDWLSTAVPLPPVACCELGVCVRDAAMTIGVGTVSRRVCRGHQLVWSRWRKALKKPPTRGQAEEWFCREDDGDSMRPHESRGLLSLSDLPASLQREVRYGIYRHAKTPNRTQWRPLDIREALNRLAAEGIETLADPRVEAIAAAAKRGMVKRVLTDLPIAARPLLLDAKSAKEAGVFDPVFVGGEPFQSSSVRHRRYLFDLRNVSQRWLRDVLWDYLSDQALATNGKRATLTTIELRISSVIVLSYMLRQIRQDAGNVAELLTSEDSAALGDLWNIWVSENIHVPCIKPPNRPVKDERTALVRARFNFTMNARTVLLHALNHNTIARETESFILRFPEYSRPKSSPRPRPLSDEDFMRLVSDESITKLEDLDTNDVGIADIWVTHAFQGGRINETLTLRLGCIGFVGAMQPYLWRDISKAGQPDYGIPCHQPVYQRLLKRQEKTRQLLRQRYAKELSKLGKRQATALEAKWDREMPLFPRPTSNPDVVIPFSVSGFQDSWMTWLEQIGVAGVTSHRTRATMATTLLDNGAPPRLVQQILGHFSDAALAFYGRYSDATIVRHLQMFWAGGPGTSKPGAIVAQPSDFADSTSTAARIDLAVVPVEHGLCRYGPVVGGALCPKQKNCTTGPGGVCEHFALTGADLAYWERKRDAGYQFAEGAPTEEAREYILSQWREWEPVIDGLREALDEAGLLEAAEQLDLRSPAQDYFNPLFSIGWTAKELDQVPGQGGGGDDGCEATAS